jgi:hypothetical protein
MARQIITTTCATCKFSDMHEQPREEGEDPEEFVPDGGYGECKRFPPVLLRPLRDEEDASTTTNWGVMKFWGQPFIVGDDCCGEWKKDDGLGVHWASVDDS